MYLGCSYLKLKLWIAFVSFLRFFFDNRSYKSFGMQSIFLNTKQTMYPGYKYLVLLSIKFKH